MKLQVLHVYKRSFPDSVGGIEQAIYNISEFTQSNELNNCVLALSEKDREDFWLPRRTRILFSQQMFEIASTPLSFSIFPKFIRLLDEVDIVHFHYPYPLANVMSLFCGRKPYIITYHSDIVRQNFLKLLIYPLEWLFLKRAKALIATSPNYLKTSRLLQKLVRKVEVIPLGIDTERVDFRSQQMTDSRNLFNEEPYFVFVGNNRYYKGLHILMEALEEAVDVNVVIAGENQKEIRQDANRKNLKNVLFLGLVGEDEKYALMRNSIGFVYPSYLRSEAFGLSLVEASLCGCSLITCEIGTGTSFVNIDGLTGIVIPPSSPRDLISAMRELKSEPRKRERYGANARKRALKLFNAEKQALKYSLLYSKICKRN